MRYLDRPLLSHLLILAAAITGVLINGCATSRPVAGKTPAQAERPTVIEKEREKEVVQAIAPTEFPRIPRADARAAKVPPGYRVEILLADLTYPTSLEFDDRGNIYVAEAGYAYGDLAAPARIWRISPRGELRIVADQLNGPVNGVLWHESALYISHRGKISALQADGSLQDLVTGLPSHGDHQNNQMSVGPDGKIYFGVGTVTNSGVVGLDNIYPYLWLTQYPDLHDIPAQDIELNDITFTTPDALTVLARQGGMVTTGAAVRRLLAREDPLLVQTSAFQPFGKAEERIEGAVKANGTILRMNPDGSALEVYAWGLRNPYGVAWGPDGRLYVADLGFDERGSRPIGNAPDVIWQVREGGWYGWPDYAGGKPVTDREFRSSRGNPPQMLLKEHPPVEKPFLTRPPHASPTKIDFSTSDEFGFEGQMFFTEFGSGTPVTAPGKVKAGAEVVRVDMATKAVQPFFGLRHESRGPSGYENTATAGPRHPVAVKFSPDGRTLYVVDFGAMAAYPAGAGPVVHPFPGTGVIWRVSRDGAGASVPVNLSILRSKE